MKQIFFLIFTFSCVSTQGQKLIKSYFTKEGKKSNEAESYYYLEGKKIPRSVNNVEFDTTTIYLDSVFSYYTSTNRIRSKEFYNEKGKLQGVYKEFYEQGALKEIGSYNNGNKSGDFTLYYPSGTSQKVINFPDEADNGGNSRRGDFKIVNYWDSTGTQLVKNGNGFCKCYFFAREYENNVLREDGNVVDGRRDLIWTTYINDTLRFRDKFSKGEFLTGMRYEDDGDEIAYKEIEKPADYRGGIQTLYAFLNKNIDYPREARRYKIQGKVYVQFVVDKDGTIKDPKILKSPDPLLSDEALRLVGLMEKWKPGVRRGKPVKSKFVLPLTFKLDR